MLYGKKLSKHWLFKLIQIRSDQTYLSDFPFQTIDQLEKYLEASIVSLYYILIEKSIQLSKIEKNGYHLLLDHIANHLGKAQGLINTLRGIVHNAKNRRCYIPNDILVQAKCSHEDFLQCCQEKDSVREAVFIIASRANEHLSKVDKLLKKENIKVEKNDRLLFLPMIATQIYLNNLQRFSFNVFDRRLFQRNGLLPLKFWWQSKFF